MDACESCSERNGKWYLMDENAEVILCGPCAKEIKKESTLERIN